MEKMKNNKWRRIPIGVLLTFALLITASLWVLPMTVSAAEGEPTIVSTEAELTEALAAGGHIQLGADITATANHTIASGKAVVFDLSEYKLDMGSNYIINNATLELCGEAGGEITGTYRCVIENRGSFTLTSGTVSNTSGNTAEKFFAIYNNGSDSEVIINGGTVSGAGNGITSDGSLTINGGAVIGASTAISASGTLTINGGEIRGGTGISNEGANVNMTGGTVTGLTGIEHWAGYGSVSLRGGLLDCSIAIKVWDGTVADCLAPGYLYYNASDEVITLTASQATIDGLVKIAPCQNHTGGTATCDTMSVCTVCRGEYIRHPDENGDCICDFCSDFTFPGTGTELDPYIVTTEAELTAVLRAEGTVYIKLGASITSASTFTIANDRTVILDLNGYTVDVGTRDFYIKEAVFELLDSAGGGQIVGTGSSVLYNYGGSFTLNSGSIINNKSGAYNGSNVVWNASGGEMIMNGGTVSGTYDGIENDIDSELTINGGTVIGLDNSGIFNYFSTLTVNDGDISGDFTAIDNTGGSVTVKGGKIYSLGDYSVGIYNGNDGNLNISDGTIDAAGEFSYSIQTADGTLADCIVPGYLLYDANDALITLTEGQTYLSGTVKVVECESHSFSTDGLCSICRYACLHEDQDESMVLCPVCQKPAALEVISGMEIAFFTNLADALAKAEEFYTQFNSESKIKLCDNITVDAPVTLTDCTATIDLNGKKITFTSTSGSCFTLDGATLMIDDTSTEQTGELNFNFSSNTESSYCMTLTNASVLTWGSGAFNGIGGFSLMLLDGSRVIQNGGEINKCVWIDNGKYTLNDGILQLPFHSNSDGSDRYTAEITINSGDILCSGMFMSNSHPHNPYIITITGGNFTQNMLRFANWLDSNNVNISGGSFDNGIRSEITPLVELLAAGYAFYDAEGNIIILTEDQTEITGKVILGGCTHSFVYTANDNVITETCANSACAHSETATIIAPANAVYNGVSNAATVAYSDGWAGNEPTIVYSGTANDGTAYTDVPVKAGEAVASITVNGMTASLNYTVAKATNEWTEAPAIVGWTYGEFENEPTATPKFGKYGDDRDVSFFYRVKGMVYWNSNPPTDADIYEMKALVQTSDNWEFLETVIEFEIKKATPTADLFDFTLPTNLNACDGLAKEAAVTVKEGIEGVGRVTVKYFKNGEPIDGAPLAVGTYTVKIEVAEGVNFLASNGSITDQAWTFTFEITDETEHTNLTFISHDNGTHDKLCLICEKTVESGADCDYTVEAAESDYLKSEANCQQKAVYYHSCACGNVGDTTFEFGEVAPNVHTYTYNLSTYNYYGKQITEKCSNGCNHNASVTLTFVGGNSRTYNGQEQLFIVQLMISGNSGAQSPSMDSILYNRNGTVVSKPCDAGSYTASITFGDKVATVEFTIYQATPTYTIPSDLIATYGQTLADVALPNGWTWEDDTQSLGDIGTNTFKATFTPEDTENYMVVSNIDVQITVKYALTPDIAKDLYTFTPPSNLICDGLPKEVTVTPVDETVGAVISIKYYKNGIKLDGAPTTVGTYTVKIDVMAGDDYHSATDITVDGWSFTFDVDDEAEHLKIELVSNNDGTHDKICSSCEKIIESGIACAGTDDNDCTTAVICSCGHTVTEAKAAHTGGTATCTAKAHCSVCDIDHGELDAANHSKATFLYTANADGTAHTKKHECCGATADEDEAHTYGDDDKCTCGAEKPIPTYTVTVENGTLNAEGETSVTVNENGSVTVTANAPTDGKVFKGWMLNGAIVSHEESYTFKATANAELKAVYEDAPDESEPADKPTESTPAESTPTESGEASGSTDETKPSADEGKDGPSGGAIAAIIIACAAVLAGGGFAIYWFGFKKKKEE